MSQVRVFLSKYDRVATDDAPVSLQVLTELLEQLVQLDNGMLNGAVLSPVDVVESRNAIHATAQRFFDNAFTLKVEAVRAWLDGLKQYQRPAGFDFKPWLTRVQAVPPPPAPARKAVQKKQLVPVKMSLINPPEWARPTEFIVEEADDEGDLGGAEAEKKLRPRMSEVLQIVQRQVNLYVNDEQLTEQDDGFPARSALAGSYYLGSVVFNSTSEFWLVHVMVYALGHSAGPRANYLSLDVSVSANRETGALAFWSIESAAI